MTELWLTKFVHAAAIAVWIGGLVATPALLAQRGEVERETNFQLERACRFLHVAVASPAAALAVTSGIVLAFLRETWVEWFSLKLLCVGLLAGMHMLIGHAVAKAFKAGDSRWVLGAVPLIAGVLTIAGAVLLLVLGKPELQAETLGPPDLFAPGGLRDLLAPAEEAISLAPTR